MGEAVYTEHNPETGLLDSLYWRSAIRHNGTYSGELVTGNGILITHDYKRTAFVAQSRTSDRSELSSSKVIFGTFDYGKWKGDFGMEFLDIGDTGWCDFITFGKGLSGMEFRFGARERKHEFYRGSRYFDEMHSQDDELATHFGVERPDVQECGYWYDGPKKIIDTSGKVDMLFRIGDRFQGSLRYRTKQSHTGLGPRDLEIEVSKLARDILDLEVIESRVDALHSD